MWHLKEPFCVVLSLFEFRRIATSCCYNQNGKVRLNRKFTQLKKITTLINRSQRKETGCGLRCRYGLNCGERKKSKGESLNVGLSNSVSNSNI